MLQFLFLLAFAHQARSQPTQSPSAEPSSAPTPSGGSNFPFTDDWRTYCNQVGETDFCMVCQRLTDDKYGPGLVAYLPGCPPVGCGGIITSNVGGDTTVICGSIETPFFDFRLAKSESFLCNGEVKTNVSPTLVLLTPDGEQSSKSCSGTNQVLFFNVASEEPATQEEVQKALNVLTPGERENSAFGLNVFPLFALLMVRAMGWIQ